MKYGLFFGQNAVDQFAAAYNPDGSSSGGWSGLLTGCVPDARDLAIAFANMGYETRALFSGWNVAGKKIPWAMSGQCTLDAWRSAHSVLQAKVRPGDVVVIGNSGHGGRYDTPTKFDGGEYMCFFDGLLYDAEQHELMCGWPEGVAVAYILDTCYSGGMDRDVLRATTRAAVQWIKPEAKRDRPEPKSADVKAMVIQLTAATKDETASDGPQNGAFTGTLLAVWEQMRAVSWSVKWQAWFDGTRQVMAAAFPDQHPVLNVLGRGSAMLDAEV